MTGWRILDLSHFEGSVRVTRGAVEIRGQRIPVADVDLMLMGPKAHFGGALVHRAAGAQTSVIVCDWKHEPVAAMYPWSSNTRVGARQLAQAEMTRPRKKNGWMRIVKAKVRSQENTLLFAERFEAAERLRALSTRVRSGDPQNIEAQAARVYWQAMYGADGFTRVPGAEDAVNAAHNYGYTVLRGIVLSAVVAAGLNPTLGMHHRGRGNVFALVDDLIEPFRCIVDRVIIADPELREDFPHADARRALVDRILARASAAGEPQDGKGPAAQIRDFVQSYAGYVEGEADVLAVPVM